MTIDGYKLVVNMNPFKPISTSLSPNVQKDDMWLSAKLLLQLPVTRYPLPVTNTLENKFKEYLGAKYAFSFNSGRSALLTILKALDIKEGDLSLIHI